MSNFRITLVGYDIVDYISKKTQKRVQGVTVYGLRDRVPDNSHVGVKCFEAFLRNVNPLDLVEGAEYDVLMEITEFNDKLQASPVGLQLIEKHK